MRPMVTWMVGSGLAADVWNLRSSHGGAAGPAGWMQVSPPHSCVLRTLASRLHDSCGQLLDPIPDFGFLDFFLRCGNPPGGPLTPYRQFFPCLVRWPVRSRHRRQPGRNFRSFQLLRHRPGHMQNPGLVTGITSRGSLSAATALCPAGCGAAHSLSFNGLINSPWGAFTR